MYCRLSVPWIPQRFKKTQKKLGVSTFRTQRERPNRMVLIQIHPKNFNEVSLAGIDMEHKKKEGMSSNDHFVKDEQIETRLNTSTRNILSGWTTTTKWKNLEESAIDRQSKLGNPFLFLGFFSQLGITPEVIFGWIFHHLELGIFFTLHKLGPVDRKKIEWN